MFPYMKLFWIVLLAAGGYYILPHSFPILLALVTAVALEPAVRTLKKSFKMRRLYAVLLTFTGFVVLTGGLFYFLITRIVIEVVELSQWVPDAILGMVEPVRQWITAVQSYYEQLPANYATTLQTSLNSLLTSANNLTKGMIDGLLTMIKSMPQLLVVTMVYVVALFLFSLDLPRLVRSFLNLFDEETQAKMRLVLANLNRAIIGFLQAQILISFLTYDLVLVGLWILGVKYALAIALIIVVVDVLPVLGTGAVMVPWMAYAFLSGNRSLGIGLLILYGLLMIFRRIIEPKILGNSLGISALATLLSMYLGFMVLGFFGLILGPALIILVQALRDAGFLKVRIHL